MHCLCLHGSHVAHALRAVKSSAIRPFMLSLEEALFVWHTVSGRPQRVACCRIRC